MRYFYSTLLALTVVSGLDAKQDKGPSTAATPRILARHDMGDKTLEFLEPEEGEILIVRGEPIIDDEERRLLRGGQDRDDRILSPVEIYSQEVGGEVPDELVQAQARMEEKKRKRAELIKEDRDELFDEYKEDTLVDDFIDEYEYEEDVLIDDFIVGDQEESLVNEFIEDDEEVALFGEFDDEDEHSLADERDQGGRRLCTLEGFCARYVRPCHLHIDSPCQQVWGPWGHCDPYDYMTCMRNMRGERWATDYAWRLASRIQALRGDVCHKIMRKSAFGGWKLLVSRCVRQGYEQTIQSYGVHWTRRAQTYGFDDGLPERYNWVVYNYG